MVMSVAELGPESYCAGEDQQQLYDRPIPSSERMLHKDYDRRGSVENKIMVVVLKELAGKTN
jgi:hypothetical protein